MRTPRVPAWRARPADPVPAAPTLGSCHAALVTRTASTQGRSGPERETEVTRQVTVAQIAKGAGVSASTVSKVLNGNSDVSAAIRRTAPRYCSEAGGAIEESAKAKERRLRERT